MDKLPDRGPSGDDGKSPPNRDQPLYQTTLDDDDDLVATIPMAVAAVSDMEIEEFPPLYAAVEPGALGRLVTSLNDEDGGSVTFDYAGYTIELQGANELVLW